MVIEREIRSFCTNLDQEEKADDRRYFGAQVNGTALKRGRCTLVIRAALVNGRHDLIPLNGATKAQLYSLKIM
jgi:hypothetical protein